MPVGIDGAIVQSYGDHSCGMVHRSVGPLIFLLLTLLMEMTVMMVTILQERCVCLCVCVCVCVCVGWNTSSTTACNRHVMLVMVGHECVLFQPPSDAAQLERRGMTVPIEPIWTEDAYTSGKNTLSGAHQVRSAYSFVLFFGHWRVDD